MLRGKEVKIMAVFTNQAILSYNDVVTSSNTVTGEIVQVLSSTKTALNESYSAGDVITYAISITNSGDTAYNGITLTDDLGAYEFGGDSLVPLTFADNGVLFYLDGVLQADPEVNAGPPLTVGPISIPARSNAIIIYRATVNRFAPLTLSGRIDNTVALTGVGITTPITASGTISAASEPMLVISKAIFPSQIVENGRISYTFTIENMGNAPADADANIVVSDLFDPILNSIQVFVNGTAVSSPETYLYDEASGQFSTVEGEITVPAATYTQDPVTGVWNVVPGRTVIVVTGNV